MSESTYKTYQKWAYDLDHKYFEPTLTIVRLDEQDDGTIYQCAIEFSSTYRDRSDVYGVILGMTENALTMSVGLMKEEKSKLPEGLDEGNLKHDEFGGAYTSVSPWNKSVHDGLLEALKIITLSSSKEDSSEVTVDDDAKTVDDYEATIIDDDAKTVDDYEATIIDGQSEASLDDQPDDELEVTIVEETIPISPAKLDEVDSEATLGPIAETPTIDDDETDDIPIPEEVAAIQEASRPEEFPEEQFHPQVNPEAPPKGGGAAVTSLVLGIISIATPCCPLLYFPLAIAGIICGIVGLQSKKRGLAIAGLICSAIGLFEGLFTTMMWFVR